MSSLSQPIRTLLLAVVVVSVALVVKNHFEGESTLPPADDDVTPPIMRVARELQPTIVEPNENWLDRGAAHLDVEESSPLTGPPLPDLPIKRQLESKSPHVLR